MKNKVKALFYFRKGKEAYVLLGKRVSQGGDEFWWLPGGSAEENEDPLEALKRELEEELILPRELKKALEGKNLPALGFQGNNHNLVYFIQVPDTKAVPRIRDEFEEVGWFEIRKFPLNMSREYRFLQEPLLEFLCQTSNPLSAFFNQGKKQ